MKARKNVPQHAAEPDFGGEALPERGHVVHLVPLSRPLPSSGVRGLGKGHCDAHPLVTQVRAEASLSPAAGTKCAADCIDAKPSQRLHARATQKLWSPTLKWATLDKMAPCGGGGCCGCGCGCGGGGECECECECCWLLVVGCWLLIVDC